MSTTDQVLKPIKFSRAIGKDFSSTLKKRVREYFKENNLSKYANTSMYIKTVFMLSLYFVPYGLMISGNFSNCGFLKKSPHMIRISSLRIEP